MERRGISSPASKVLGIVASLASTIPRDPRPPQELAVLYPKDNNYRLQIVSLSINNLYATQIEKKRDQITDCLKLFELLLKTMRARPIEQNLDEFACLFDHSHAVLGLMYAATMVAYESTYPAGYLLRIRFPPH